MSAFVQKRSVYPGTSLAYSASPTAGNLLVVWIVWHTGTLTGVSGSRNGAFTVSPTFGSSFTFCAMAYKYNCAGGSETISLGGTLNDPGFTIYEFSGIQTASDPLDGSIVGTAQASPTTTPSAAPFSNSATGLIVVGIGDEGTTQTSLAQGAGYTLGESQLGHLHADEYALTVAPGSQAASFTLGAVCSTSPDCLVVVACFKDAGAGPPGGGWVGSGSRRALSQRGPYDRRGFILSPYQRYSYVASVVVAPTVIILQRKTLGTTGNHVGGRQRRD